jgi:hypothetical protein
MRRVSLATLALIAAIPAAAQERGGVHMRDPTAILGEIDANRGCPMSATSVTVGLNKSMGTRSSAQQRLATSGSADPSGCHPLVSTQVVTGVNMALGRGSSAGQTINAQGPRGALATTNYTRGYNIGYGAYSSAQQSISNRTSR